MDYENSVHLDPDLTWEDIGSAIYNGVKEGKLTEKDCIKFLQLGASENEAPRINRIFAKALGTFFKAKEKTYPLKDGETAGIFLKVDNKKWLVMYRGDDIVVESVNYDAPDRSFVIRHASVADAKIAAWENNERYVQEG